MQANFRTIAPEKYPIFELDKPKIDFYNLNNGIKCWYVNSPEMELIRLDFKFQAGSWYQSKMFVANFTGNMLYEGSTKYSSQEIAERMDSKGVYFGVTPELDNVSIVFYIPKIYFEDILPIIHEIVFNAVFPNIELDILKKKESMSLAVNFKKPSFLSRYYFRSTLYGKNYPYGLFPEITKLDDVSRDDLQHFYRNNYLNNGYKVYITGNIDDKLLKVFNSYFGQKEIAKCEVQTKNHELVTIKNKDAIRVKMDDTVQRSVRIGKITVGRNHSDYYDLALLSTVFGGYFGSRLMKNIREEKGYTYGIGASIVNLIHSSYFSIYTDVGKEVCEKAIDEIYIEMDKLLQNKISEQELERVKQYLSGSLLRSIDGAVNIMDKFIDFDDFGLGIDHFQYQMDKIVNANANDLLCIAQKYFNKDEMIEVVVG